MTFKPDISETSIYNQALALLPAQSVADPAEQSLEADECRRVYKDVVANLLERHHWNLATRRVELAALTNDRDREWRYAFAKPSDMAYPVKALDLTGQGFTGWMLDGFTYLLGGSPVFMQVGGTLYSMIEVATLEYTSFDITEADFTTTFKDLVVLELAARICHPITKDDARAKDLATRAEVERQRAIGSDLNRNQPTYGNRPTETELVRGVGIDRTMFTGNYPLDPVAYPSVTG